MSEGNFVAAFYQTDEGGICNCRVQPETLLATFGGTANDSAAGPADQEASANMTSDRRGNGVFARYARVNWTSPPTDYTGASVNIPVLSQATAAAAVRGAAVSYLGGTGVVGTLVRERVG